MKKITDSFEKVFGDKQNIMIVTAHPDDNEIICGGIVARLIAEKKNVRLIVMTNGGKGFQNRTDTDEIEFAKIRISEQIAAGRELGIKDENNINLNIKDGECENTLENIEKLVFHIREFKPEIIITHNPFDPINSFNKDIHWVNHRDHRNTASIVLDAVYPYSRDRGFFPKHFTQKLEPHIVSELLFSDSYSYQDVKYFEITNFVDKKRKALHMHKNALSSEQIENEFLEEIKLTPTKSYERLKHVCI